MTVAHHTELPGRKIGAEWYGLRNDGQTIGMHYPPGILTEMSVAEALGKTPSEHIAQANQNDEAKTAQATEAQVLAMNNTPSHEMRGLQR